MYMGLLDNLRLRHFAHYEVADYSQLASRKLQHAVIRLKQHQRLQLKDTHNDQDKDKVKSSNMYIKSRNTRHRTFTYFLEACNSLLYTIRELTSPRVGNPLLGVGPSARCPVTTHRARLRSLGL